MRCKEQTITFYPDIHSEKTMTEVFPETRLAFETSGSTAVATAAANFAIEDGKSYIVEFDDVLHEIVAASGALTNDLFRVTVADGVMTVSIAQEGSHTVRVITCTTHVCKMPKEYLPEGSGGGVSSWNDLTDKPFYSEWVDTLPETTVEIDPEEGQGHLPNVLDVRVGNTYTVKWNGTEYNCIAKPYDIGEGVTAALLGNLGAMTENEADLTDDPFVLMCFDAATAAAMGLGAAFLPLDGSTSVTLSIRGELTHKLDEKYMPSYTVLYVEEIADGYLYKTADTSDESNRITSAELKSLWLGGRKVFVRAPMLDGSGNFMGYFWLNSFVLMDYGSFCQLFYENRIVFYPAEQEAQPSDTAEVGY